MAPIIPVGSLSDDAYTGNDGIGLTIPLLKCILNSFYKSLKADSSFARFQDY